MKRFARYYTVMLAVVLGAMALFVISCGDSSNTTGSDTTQSNPALVTQNSQAGNVTVAVTPADVSASSATWKFNVTMDSTGAELNDDMTQAAVLVGPDGKDNAAKSWDGDGPGGQHRQGTVSFDAISPMPKSVTLKIRGVGGIGERSFSWMIGQ